MAVTGHKDTGRLKKFAQTARRQLLEQIGTRLEKVLHTDNVEIREQEKAIKELQSQIKQTSKEAVIDQVAYTWFNRFCALRYMDVNHYSPIGIVSPAGTFTQPEILQEAKSGVIDLAWKVDQQRVRNLLNGKLPSSNPQQEAFRLLLVGVCNAYHTQMPFLFPEIEDYSELLMPEDLLSPNSILYGVRDTLTEETCRDVEVIGWLYQYYISERKDEVFENLKKNIKIEVKDIPAATQLFTPHWIVRYLVENSLGRLWMLNHPDSKLVERMEYYIKPVQEETDFLKIISPEEIKVCDPACGSGHMLTYAFDLLYAIYEEQGYDPVQIPQLILNNNLFGIEIDQRAGELAAFALTMKARLKDKRFFTREIVPNICVLENITFTASELSEYKKVVGSDLFTQDLWVLLTQFEQAKDFGSLIRPQVKHPEQLLERLNELGVFNDMLLFSTNEKVKKVLKQADYLSTRYHVVVANPPFMGTRNMNKIRKSYLAINYADVKSDLFSAFIVRNIDFTIDNGILGFVTPFVWMYLSSYEKLRDFLISRNTICNLVKPSYTSFFASAIVPLVAFVIIKEHKNLIADFVDLGYLGSAESQPIKLKEAIQTRTNEMFFQANPKEFKKIPGAPIAYWTSNKIREIFNSANLLRDFAEPRQGMATSENDRFLRFWSEVAFSKIGFGINSNEEAKKTGLTWFPYNKGGSFRKWFGNNEYVVNWKNDGYEIKATVKEKYPYLNGNVDYVVKNRDYYFKESITWSFISSSHFGVRYSNLGSIFDVAGSSVFPPKQDIYWLTGFLCSNLSPLFLNILNPTMNYQVGDVAVLPIISPDNKETTIEIVKSIIKISENDWDSSELSWNFSEINLLDKKYRSAHLAHTYKSVRKNWNELTKKVRQLEEENNQIFIEAYGLQDERTASVPIEEITLFCNPYYRYGNEKSEVESDALLLAATMKEFISYAVGCMFGRYSLDKPGLILANQGETLEDYLKQIPDPKFLPDKDNVIPVLEGEWFNDDIVERFKKFLKVTFGTENYEENLSFLEEAIGKNIRSYFIKDFCNEHVKTYKKRPIYWMFSSPNGSFNCLIYMHRYCPDTVSIILNDYLRQYRDKLTAHKAQQEATNLNPTASQAEKTKALREIEKINKVLSELKEYEDKILFPLATQQIKIDLDDGVLVNYKKFGKALKHINGLSE